MNLDFIIFPAPKSSYTDKTLKGELIWIPKYKNSNQQLQQNKEENKHKRPNSMYEAGQFMQKSQFIKPGIQDKFINKPITRLKFDQQLEQKKTVQPLVKNNNLISHTAQSPKTSKKPSFKSTKFENKSSYRNKQSHISPIKGDQDIEQYIPDDNFNDCIQDQQYTINNTTGLFNKQEQEHPKLNINNSQYSDKKQFYNLLNEQTQQMENLSYLGQQMQNSDIKTPQKQQNTLQSYNELYTDLGEKEGYLDETYRTQYCKHNNFKFKHPDTNDQSHNITQRESIIDNYDHENIFSEYQNSNNKLKSNLQQNLVNSDLSYLIKEEDLNELVTPKEGRKGSGMKQEIPQSLSSYDTKNFSMANSFNYSQNRPHKIYNKGYNNQSSQNNISRKANVKGKNFLQQKLNDCESENIESEDLSPQKTGLRNNLYGFRQIKSNNNSYQKIPSFSQPQKKQNNTSANVKQYNYASFFNDNYQDSYNNNTQNFNYCNNTSGNNIVRNLNQQIYQKEEIQLTDVKSPQLDQSTNNIQLKENFQYLNLEQKEKQNNVNPNNINNLNKKPPLVIQKNDFQKQQYLLKYQNTQQQQNIIHSGIQSPAIPNLLKQNINTKINNNYNIQSQTNFKKQINNNNNQLLKPQTYKQQIKQQKVIENHIPCLYLQSQIPTPITAIYFHGNAEDIYLSYELLDDIRQQLLINIIAIEYPGYGIYKGKCSEKQIIEDGEYLINYLINDLQFKLENLIIIGRSIGTGIATYLASRYNVMSLLLISPFTSLKAVVKHLVGNLASLLIKERFNNLEIIEKVKCFTFLIHGKSDKMIPYSHSQQLYQNCKNSQCGYLYPDDMTHVEIDFYNHLIQPFKLFLNSKSQKFQNRINDLQNYDKNTFNKIPQQYFKNPYLIQSQSEKKLSKQQLLEIQKTNI